MEVRAVPVLVACKHICLEAILCADDGQNHLTIRWLRKLMRSWTRGARRRSRRASHMPPRVGGVKWRGRGSGVVRASIIRPKAGGKGARELARVKACGVGRAPKVRHTAGAWCTCACAAGDQRRGSCNDCGPVPAGSAVAGHLALIARPLFLHV